MMIDKLISQYVPGVHGKRFRGKLKSLGIVSLQTKENKMNQMDIAMTFHHVGVAVKNIKTALETYTGIFGFRRLTPPLEVSPQRVKVCFVEAPPGVLIELVEGIGDNSPVKKVLERSGSGPYHLCYKVDDLDEAIGELEARGCILFRRFEMPAHGLRRFAFLFTPDNQLFELCDPAARGAHKSAAQGAGKADADHSQR
jgi:methylmalonyl-CoA/ethylmalonyl-CoA epimerase